MFGDLDGDAQGAVRQVQELEVQPLARPAARELPVLHLPRFEAASEEGV